MSANEEDDVAVRWSLKAAPTLPDAAAGVASVTVSDFTVTLQDALAEAPLASRAERVTAVVPLVVGAPVITPEVEFSVNPAGSPLAEYVTALPTELVAEAFVETVPWLIAVNAAGGVKVTLSAALKTEEELAHAPVALDHMAWTAYEPVDRLRLTAPPVPPVPTQAHLSPIS